MNKIVVTRIVPNAQMSDGWKLDNDLHKAEMQIDDDPLVVSVTRYGKSADDAIVNLMNAVEEMTL